jgi:hypothetical protein
MLLDRSVAVASNKMKKQNAILVVVAAGLLLASFLFARCGEEQIAGKGGATIATPVKQIEFPRDRKRRKPAAVVDVAAPPPRTPSVGRDKLSRALASPGKDGALVVEVNAIRHSPLVDKLLACEQARRGDGANGLQTLKEQLGVDVTEDVDRVAFDKDVLAVSGFFQDLKLPEELGAGDSYGDGGRIFKVKDDGGKDMVIGKVGDELLVTGFNEEQVKAAIDRAEGRGTTGPTFPEGLAAGEVYGLVGPAFLKDLMTDVNDPAANRLAEVITQSTVQIAVDDAAALSLDIQARTPDEGKDLGKALGGIVSMARAQAEQDGNEELAGLLEQANIVPRDDGSVAFDLAVPGKDLLRLFGCGENGPL